MLFFFYLLLLATEKNPVLRPSLQQLLNLNITTRLLLFVLYTYLTIYLPDQQPVFLNCLNIDAELVHSENFSYSRYGMLVVICEYHFLIFYEFPCLCLFFVSTSSAAVRAGRTGVWRFTRLYSTSEALWPLCWLSAFSLWWVQLPW